MQTFVRSNGSKHYEIVVRFRFTRAFRSFQVYDDGLAAPNQQHALAVRDTSAGASANTATAAADTVSSSVKDASNAAGNAIGSTSDQLTSLVKGATTMVTDFGTEATRTVEDVMKAGGRATLAVGDLCTQLFDGVLSTAAAGSGYVASGSNAVHGYVGSLPVVRVITGGLSNFMDSFSNTFSEVSSNGRQSRRKMFDELRNKLNKSVAGSAATPAATTAATTAASNSAAGPTK